MKFYADSSFLVSLYTHDANTLAAFHLLGRYGTPPLPWISVHALEVKNALRQKVFRQEISALDLTGSLRLLEQDRANGALVDVPSPLLPQIWGLGMDRAEQLSNRYAQARRMRALDIMHVAFALELRAEQFWTFDDDQQALAEAEGLKTT